MIAIFPVFLPSSKTREPFPALKSCTTQPENNAHTVGVYVGWVTLLKRLGWFGSEAEARVKQLHFPPERWPQWSDRLFASSCAVRSSLGQVSWARPAQDGFILPSLIQSCLVDEIWVGSKRPFATLNEILQRNAGEFKQTSCPLGGIA